MNAPTTRGQAIAAFCRDCIFDHYAIGTWRVQVACCGSSGCALWRFRPLPRNAPPWIASRDPADLPNGWTTAEHDAAVNTLRARIDAKVTDDAVQAHGGTRAPDPLLPQRPGSADSETVMESTHAHA